MVLPMFDSELFGLRVRLFRLQQNIPQEELAQRVKLSRVHISHLERGERLPSLETFINIANALHVSADDLLAGQINATIPHYLQEEVKLLSNCSPKKYQILIQNMEELEKLLKKNYGDL